MGKFAIRMQMFYKFRGRNFPGVRVDVTQMRFALKEYNKDIKVTCYAICFIKSQEELSYFLSILYSFLF